MVALHLDNNAVKAFLCIQGGTSSLFLSQLVCDIFNLSNKHGITVISVYLPTNLKEEADYLSWG